MGLDISSLEIEIAGTFNPATFEGRDADQRAGLQDIEVRLRVDADADEETVATWGERVEERCPVSDNIKHETSVALTVTAN